MSTDNKNVMEDINRSLQELRTKTEEGLTDVVRKDELAKLSDHVTSQIKDLQDAMAAQNTVKSVEEAIDEEIYAKRAAVQFFTKGNNAFGEAGEDGFARCKTLGSQAGTQASLGFTSDGGALLPRDFGALVDGIIRKSSPVRGDATVVSRKEGFITPYKTSKGSAGVRSEFGGLTMSNATQFDTIKHEFYEINATQPISYWASQGDVKDFDLLAIMLQDVAESLAEVDAHELMLGTHQNVKGSGGYVNNGLLSQTKLADGTVDRFTNVVGSLAGIAGATYGEVKPDEVMALLTSLHPVYHANCSLYMAPETMEAVLTAKDNQERYLFTIGSVQEGFKPAVWSKPIVVTDYMVAPSAAAATDPLIIAADMKQAVTIANATEGLSWLVDNITDKRFIQYTARFRTASAIVNYGALRALYSAAAS